MADAVQVFSPGFRVTDNTTGAALSGAVIRFYDELTTNPKTVYADEDLLTALGTSVTCDSLGYPTSNGTTKTLVYVGPQSYKVTIETSAGVVIATHDEVKGAVEASSGGGDISGAVLGAIETKSLDYTVVAGDTGKTFLLNCSSADVTLTLPSAVTVGNGFQFIAIHAGSANQGTLETVSSQTIRRGGLTYDNAFSLVTNGEGVRVQSDGGNWVITSYSPPVPLPSTGVFTIADRLSTPPGSPVDGALYILTSSPTGAWSTFAEHDIAYWTGSDWVRVPPPSDCGWLAYVQDEDETYQVIGSAWVQLITRPASQAEMETGTSLLKAVTPGRQHNHPGHPKFWAFVTVSGGTSTLTTSYNVTSITDSGEGILTVTIATDFSSANWAPFVSVQRPDTGGDNLDSLFETIRFGGIAAGSVVVEAHQIGQDGNIITLQDPATWSVCGFGDQ